MKVAILGAGHAGIAMAAGLNLAGHEVWLAAVPGHSENLQSCCRRLEASWWKT